MSKPNPKTLSEFAAQIAAELGADPALLAKWVERVDLRPQRIFGKQPISTGVYDSIIRHCRENFRGEMVRR